MGNTLNANIGTGQETSFEDDRALLDLDLNEDGSPKTVEKEVDTTDLGEKKVKEKSVETKEETKEEIKEGEEVEAKEEKKEEKEETKEVDLTGYQKLTAKYPNIFKEFPELRDKFFREEEFSKIYASVEDAREAQENSENYAFIRDEVMEGKLEGFFGSIKEADPETIGKIANNFLPTLFKLDKEQYYDVVNPVIESVLKYAYKEGMGAKNDNLKNSALVISHYLFGDQGYATGEKTTNKVPKEIKEDSELSREKTEFYQEKLTTYKSEVDSHVVGKLNNLIDEGLDEEDKKVLTPYVQKILKRDIVQEVDKLLRADERFTRYINSLWTRAFKTGFSGDWKARIQNAWLARAETLVPSVRAKLLTEILGTAKNSGNRKKQIAAEVSSEREIPSSGSSRSSGTEKVYSAKEVDWSKTSDRDLLEGKVTVRR